MSIKDSRKSLSRVEVFFRVAFYLFIFFGISIALYCLALALIGGQSGTGTLRFVCGFVSFIVTIILTMAKSYSVVATFFDMVVKGFSFDAREKSFRCEYPQIPYLRWGDESPAYAVFQSESRNALIRQLRADSDVDSAQIKTSDIIKSGFYVVYGPPNSGKETLLLGESLSTRRRVSFFMVPESVWMDGDNDAHSVRRPFVKAVNDLMGGYIFWEGPHVLLVLDTGRLFFGNAQAKRKLIENVREWSEHQLRHRELVTVVLKINDIGSHDELQCNGSTKPVEGCHYVGYLDQHECYDFACKIIDAKAPENEILRIKKKIPEGLNITDEARKYIFNMTRGVPSAVVALIRPDLGVRAAAKVADGWRVVLHELGARGEDEKRFLSALYILSLLSGEVVDLDEMAEMFEVDPDRLFKFMSSLLSARIRNTLGGVLRHKKFEVSWFTDLFPEELLIRGMGGGDGGNSFRQEIFETLSRPRIRAYLSRQPHLNRFVDNLQKAIWPKDTLWKLMPERIHVFRVMVDWIKNGGNGNGDAAGVRIGNAIEDRMFEVLYEYIWHEICELDQVVDTDEITDVLEAILDEFSDASMNERLKLFDIIAPELLLVAADSLKHRHDFFDIGMLALYVESFSASLTEEIVWLAFVVRMYYIMGVAKIFERGGSQSLGELDGKQLENMNHLGKEIIKFFTDKGLMNYVVLNNKLVAVASASAAYRGDRDVPKIKEQLAMAICDCADFVLSSKAAWKTEKTWNHILTWLYAYDVNVFNGSGSTMVADKLLSVVKESNANVKLKQLKLHSGYQRRIIYEEWPSDRTNDGFSFDALVDKVISDRNAVISNCLFSVNEKLRFVSNSASVIANICLKIQNAERFCDVGDDFFRKIEMFRQNATFPTMIWYSAYLSRLIGSGACSIVKTNANVSLELQSCFRQYCSFIKQMIAVCEPDITVLTAKDSDPVFETLSSIYGKVGDYQVDASIERVFLNPFVMLSKANARALRSFLWRFCGFVVARDFQEEFYSVFIIAVRVWTGKDCNDWHMITKLKPRDDEKYLPGGLLVLVALYVKKLSTSLDDLSKKAVLSLSRAIDAMVNSGYYLEKDIEFVKSILPKDVKGA